MTVQELIKRLEQLPSYLEVLLDLTDNDEYFKLSEIGDVSEVEVEGNQVILIEGAKIEINEN